MAATLPSILSQLSFPASSGAFSFLWTINRPVTTQSIAVRKAGNAFKQRKDLRGFCPPLPIEVKEFGRDWSADTVFFA